MNIALPTLIVIAGLVPGIIFVNSYYAGRFPRELAGLSTLTELALYCFWALAVDAIAIRAFVGDISEANVRAALRFAAGQPQMLDVQNLVLGLTGLGWWNIATAYTVTVVGAGLAGGILRRLVWACRLDVYLPFLRMKSEWFYTLQGRLRGLSRLDTPVADVLVSHPGEGTRLYTGIVAALSSAEDGKLDQLLLVAAQRHSGRGLGVALRDIPGRSFAVMGQTIHSINMRYHSRAQLDLPILQSKRALCWAHMIAWCRALIFEEP